MYFVFFYNNKLKKKDHKKKIYIYKIQQKTNRKYKKMVKIYKKYNNKNT